MSRYFEGTESLPVGAGYGLTETMAFGTAITGVDFVRTFHMHTRASQHVHLEMHMVYVRQSQCDVRMRHLGKASYELWATSADDCDGRRQTARDRCARRDILSIAEWMCQGHPCLMVNAVRSASSPHCL